MNKHDLHQINRTIGYEFSEKSLLECALTHSSIIGEKKESTLKCNERLEFLGDAFFDAIISEELYKRLPQDDEGNLTKYRAQVVCEDALAQMARHLELGDKLFMGRGEEMNGGRQRASILADAVEAIIGAIYLDGGYQKVRKWVLTHFSRRIDGAISGAYSSDYKSLLQEIWQQRGGVKIEYCGEKEEGPDHDKTFYVSVFVDHYRLGSGAGKSKKEAEQNAAKEAIEKGRQNVL